MRAFTELFAISSGQLSLPHHNSVYAHLWDQWSVDHDRLRTTAMITIANWKTILILNHTNILAMILKICLDLVRGLVDWHGAVINNCKLFMAKEPMS